MSKRGTNPKSLANLKEPWKAGQSGNPKGRPRAGLVLVEYINDFAQAKPSRKELRRIADDENEDPFRSAAALRVLLLIERGDLAMFDDFLHGEKTLQQLKDDGIDTSIVKSAKVTPGKYGESRSIELHDRSGEEFDRICDRTEGKPRQAVDVGGNLQLTGIEITIPGLQPGAKR